MADRGSSHRHHRHPKPENPIAHRVRDVATGKYVTAPYVNISNEEFDRYKARVRREETKIEYCLKLGRCNHPCGVRVSNHVEGKCPPCSRIVWFARETCGHETFGECGDTEPSIAKCVVSGCFGF